MEYVIIFMIFAIFVNVVMGVIFRYVLNNPLSFNFDLATLLFSWTTFLGLMVAARKKAHIGVDFFTNYLSPRAAKAVDLIMNLIIVFISAMMLYLGFMMTKNTNMILTGLEISQKWLYASLPTGFGLYLLLSIVEVIEKIRNFRQTAVEGD